MASEWAMQVILKYPLGGAVFWLFGILVIIRKEGVINFVGLRGAQAKLMSLKQLN